MVLNVLHCVFAGSQPVSQEPVVSTPVTSTAPVPMVMTPQPVSVSNTPPDVTMATDNR